MQIDKTQFLYHVCYKRYLQFLDKYARTDFALYGYYGEHGRFRFNW
jgi:hypothetical protein